MFPGLFFFSPLVLNYIIINNNKMEKKIASNHAWSLCLVPMKLVGFVFGLNVAYYIYLYLYSTLYLKQTSIFIYFVQHLYLEQISN